MRGDIELMGGPPVPPTRENNDPHLQDYNLSNYDVKIMFSVIFSVLLELVFFKTFTLKVSVIQFQEIVTYISLRQMDNFRFGGKYSQSIIEFSI